MLPLAAQPRRVPHHHSLLEYTHSCRCSSQLCAGCAGQLLPQPRKQSWQRRRRCVIPALLPVPSQDHGGPLSLDAYMRLPTEQYSELDPAMIFPLGSGAFLLKVPRVQASASRPGRGAWLAGRARPPPGRTLPVLRVTLLLHGWHRNSKGAARPAPPPLRRSPCALPLVCITLKTPARSAACHSPSLPPEPPPPPPCSCLTYGWSLR